MEQQAPSEDLLQRLQSSSATSSSPPPRHPRPGIVTAAVPLSVKRPAGFPPTSPFSLHFGVKQEDEAKRDGTDDVFGALMDGGSDDDEKAASSSGPAPRHSRSVSVDSFMEGMNFEEESGKILPSVGRGMHSRRGSFDGSASNFGLDEFSGPEMKKIMANEKLAEIAMADPKRAKRILANRQSAARSKERKLRYISELEHKVQILQTEATTLSAQLTLLQRDSAGLTSQNNELKFRLQAMEQQARLRDALNEALTAEVQRLKVVTREIGDGSAAGDLNQLLSLNTHLFHMNQQQQSTQQPFYQMSKQQQHQDQKQQDSSSNAE